MICQSHIIYNVVVSIRLLFATVKRSCQRALTERYTSTRATRLQKPLDNLYTNMITCVMLARQIILPHPPNSANSFTPTLLQPLGSPFAISVVCFQQLAASFDKTPGWGGTYATCPQGFDAAAYRFSSTFVFTNLQTPFSATPLLAHLYKTPGGVGYNSGQFQFGNALASIPGTSFSAFL